jgi:hypothetical protein
MTEFLVETYAPRKTVKLAVGHVADVARAADEVSQHGTEVRLLRAIFAPEEETCFYLYESPSADAVHEAATRARLAFGRVTEAISLTTSGRAIGSNGPMSSRARGSHRTPNVGSHEEESH